jgi:Cu2+-exporting ATPase
VSESIVRGIAQKKLKTRFFVSLSNINFYQNDMKTSGLDVHKIYYLCAKIFTFVAKIIIIICEIMTNSISNKKVTFPVLKMSCARCAANVQKTLRQQPGVKSANVNFANKTVSIEYNTTATNAEKLRDAIRLAGYDLFVTSEEEEETGNVCEKLEEEEKRQYRQLKRLLIIAVPLSAVLIILSMTSLMHQPWSKPAMAILSTPVLFFCGSRFFVGAYKQAKHKQMNMDTLVALSTATAYVFSLFGLFFSTFWTRRGFHSDVYFEATAVIITFVLLGKLLEERAKQKTSASVKKLIALQPKTATIVREGGQWEEIPIKNIRINDILLVKAGEKIAVDGTITEGHSFVDESMITGEAIPLEKNQGENVFAGTINQNGTFKLRAMKIGRETLLAQIIQLVEEAQNTKAPIQKQVDKVTGIFVPIVVTIALFSALMWLAFKGENDWVYALLAFVTVLIIACPCALGLATPTAIMVGMGKGAEQGILIKDMDSLETLRKVDTIVLDKTGTITQGIPAVTDVKWLIPETDHLRNILFNMEKASGHPFAEAIASFLPDAGAENPIVLEVKPGKGVRATIAQEIFYVGNSRLFQSVPIDAECLEWIAGKEDESKTVVLFGSDARIFALFALADKIKDSARQAIEQWQAAGIDVIMATGDNNTTAKEIARQAGIKEYFSYSLPDDKLHLIERKQQAGKVVVMVGDGINDSAAMAQANVSIAMGKGSDITIEIASVTIISGDLRKINTAIQLSRNTVATIRQNLFWAFIYNLISIPVAAGILYPFNGFLLNPMFAGAAMALSSVSVVINSLRFNGSYGFDNASPQAAMHCQSREKHESKVSEYRKELSQK